VGRNQGERERGEGESLVISISIPSAARAARQPVRPNKQPAEGGTPHYYFLSFFSHGVHIPPDREHRGPGGGGPGLALRLCWSLRDVSECR